MNKNEEIAIISEFKKINLNGKIDRLSPSSGLNIFEDLRKMVKETMFSINNFFQKVNNGIFSSLEIEPFCLQGLLFRLKNAIKKAETSTFLGK
jgi:hypothetical protein